MTEGTVQEITKSINNLQVETTIVHPLLNNNEIDECEAAEEAVTTDSEEYLSETLRYRDFQYSRSSSNRTLTMLTEENENFLGTNGFNLNNIQIPIVGYEVMEERARFTVFKLRIENKSSGDCWYVFRRYTDFVRLCNKIKQLHPFVVRHLPRKKWLGNNFDPNFLEDRVNGLQTLVNAILQEPDLISLQHIQDFFCLNEPPIYSDSNQESRAMFEAFEDTIYQLKQQLREKDKMIDSLEDSLHTKGLENENLKKAISNSILNCEKCQKEYENVSKILYVSKKCNNINSPVSSSSSDF